ncbi:hypothetical protein GIB67_035231 [Kingdonia uniflora]|uniref:Glycosyltransferase n=1 Tax=Kingdonia uniflora TaxID=39325 RepID=A0A7J7KXR0_9MAGN|nr:hypothetical protein GIB67_035231 [Kingdonia uniflora]
MKCSEKTCSRRILLVPYPAQGHVTPMLQLAIILRDRGFEPVIITPEFIHSRITKLPNNNNNIGVSFASIPDGLEGNETIDFFTISNTMENCMPLHLERIIRNDGKVLCVIVDLLASWAIEVVNHCKVPAAGFWPAMLSTYNLISTIPDMIRLGHISELGSPRHQGTVCLPGKAMLTTGDLPWLIGNPVAQESRFRFWMRILNRSKSLRWLLVNSFPEEECETDILIEQQDPTTQTCPKVFKIGPLTTYTGPGESLRSFWEEDRSCLSWLDSQRHLSVVYVSFGSWVGPIGEEKVREIALGLEAAKMPFIWVLADTWRKGLPEGYLEKVTSSGNGKVVSWAPQKEILQHDSIGCYLTHCGWNSTTEAIECGKRLLCYPVAGDQFVNCNYIVNVWGIGVKMDGIGRDDIEKGVRKLMEEGGDIQERVMKLKKKIVSELGSSRAMSTLTAFINDLNEHTTHIP